MIDAAVCKYHFTYVSLVFTIIDRSVSLIIPKSFYRTEYYMRILSYIGITIILKIERVKLTD